MRISDWSSDVCSSDLQGAGPPCPRSALRSGRGVGLRGWKDGDLEPQLRFHRLHEILVVVRSLHETVRRDDLGAEIVLQIRLLQIGRASCRERVCQYV